MNKDRVKGAAREARGTIKEATGKATGNASLQAKGAAQKFAGKALNTKGKAEDRAKKL
ncbi:MAG TPA: CsbD family protein [Caulobacteraceae bacterium]